MEKLRGSRARSSLYVYKGYCYMLNRVNENKKYFSCIKRKTCNGRAVIWGNLEPHLSKKHNHQPDADTLVSKLKFRQSLNYRAKTENTPLPVIYREEVERLKNDNLKNVTYDRLRRTMYRKRYGGTPKVPSNISDLGVMMNEAKWKHLFGNIFAEVITGLDGNSVAIFYLDTVKKIASKGRAIDLHLDSYETLIRRPYTKYKFFVVFTSCNGSVYPLMCALMESDSFEMYQLALSYLKSTLAPGIKVQAIMSDFIDEMQEACKDVFPECPLFGSWYNYSQSIYKFSKQRKLFKRRCPIYRKIIKKVMGLPLLPPGIIEDGIDYLMNETLNYEEIQPLFEYLIEVWLPQNISVLAMRARALDAFHTHRRDFSCIFQKSYPHIWNLIARLSSVFRLFNVMAEMVTPSRKTWNRNSSVNLKLQEVHDKFMTTGNLKYFFEYVVDLTNDHLVLLEISSAQLLNNPIPLSNSTTKNNSDSPESDEGEEELPVPAFVSCSSQNSDLEYLNEEGPKKRKFMFSKSEPPPLIFIDNKKPSTCTTTTTTSNACSDPPPLILLKKRKPVINIYSAEIVKPNKIMKDNNENLQLNNNITNEAKLNFKNKLIETCKVLKSSLSEICSDSDIVKRTNETVVKRTSSPPPLLYFSSKK